MTGKSRRVPDWLADIQDAVANVTSDIGSQTREEFRKDGKTQRAVIKGLIDIGEASNTIMNLNPSLMRSNPDLWQHFKDAYAMRIRLTHHYHRIDASVVYDTVKNHLPVFADLVRSFAAAAPPRNEDSQPPGE